MLETACDYSLFCCNATFQREGGVLGEAIMVVLAYYNGDCCAGVGGMVCSVSTEEKYCCVDTAL